MEIIDRIETGSHEAPRENRPAGANHGPLRVETAPEPELAPRQSIRRSVLEADVQPYFEAVLRSMPWPPTNSSRKIRAVGLASFGPGEGTSTITSLLAATAASLGNYSVLVIDANLLRPTQHRLLRVSRGPGLTDVLVDDVRLDAALHASPRGEVYVMPVGRADVGPAVFGTGHLSGMFKELKVDFDLVLVDLPPLGQCGAAIDLANQLDGVLLVAQNEHTTAASVRRMRDMLGRNHTPLLGAVLNKLRRLSPGWNE